MGSYAGDFWTEEKQNNFKLNVEVDHLQRAEMDTYRQVPILPSLLLLSTQTHIIFLID